MALPSHRILGFLGYLRREGYLVGLPEALDILKTVSSGRQLSRNRAWHAIRALVCRNEDQWRRFDLYFRRFWFPREVEVEEQDIVAQIDPRVRATSRLSGIAGSSAEDPDSTYGDAGLRGSGAGNQRTITRTDFRFLTDKKSMRQVEYLADQLAQQLKRRLIRRRTFQFRGTRLDIRKTIRKSLSTAGFPVNRVFAVRKTELPQLLILHDISHSMAWNNPLLFRFSRGLVRTFNSSEAFAFHTRLFPVTQYYRELSLKVMREKLETSNHLWMGGTCIARSIGSFNQTYSKRSVHPKTIVIIISDGFDTDEPQKLNQELNWLRARVKCIFWLNPMLGREGVRTTSEILKQCYPAVDEFMPANSLDGLKQALSKIGKSAKWQPPAPKLLNA